MAADPQLGDRHLAPSSWSGHGCRDCRSVFLGACLILTVTGVAILHRTVYQRWSLWPLLAAIPAYHGALMAGFVNFSFGVALIPFGLASWIALQSRSLPLRLGAHSVFVLILYFCHMLSLGLFGILLGSLVVCQWLDRRRAHVVTQRWTAETLVLALPFLAALGFYLLYSFVEIVGNDSKLLYGTWAIGPKLRGIMMPVLTHNFFLDCLSLCFLVCVPLALFCNRQLKTTTGLLLGATIITALFLVLPGDLLAASFVIERFLIVSILILIAATKPHNIKPNVGRAIATAFVVLLISRSTILTTNWLESDDYYRRAEVMAEAVDHGASVLVVSPFSDPEVKSMELWRHRFREHADWHYSLINIPNVHSLPILPLTRQATFTPLHFTQADKQVLSLRPDVRNLTEGDGGSATVSPNAILGRFGEDHDQGTMPTLASFDYLLVLYLDHMPPDVFKKFYDHHPVYADKDMLLLDIKRLRSAN